MSGCASVGIDQYNGRMRRRVQQEIKRQSRHETLEKNRPLVNPYSITL